MTISTDDILKRLAGLSPKDRAEIEKAAMAATAGKPFIPQPGPQTEAYFSEADVLLYGGAVAGGKGLRKQQLTLTPFGWKAIGSLKEGDAMCATDGTIQKVLAVFERGEQPLYKLTWHDGTETVCDADHIWLGWESGRAKKLANVKTQGEASARKWTTQEVFALYQRPSHGRLGIPVLSAPAAFNVTGGRWEGRSIPGYVLGALLGDGCMSDPEGVVRLYSADEGVPARVGELLGVVLQGSADKRNACTGYRIPLKTGVREALQGMKLLGCTSLDKFIPRVYLFAPTSERWELLRGLMDTDGWAEEDGDCYYCTVSERLMLDVRHLARSLGAIVTLREKVPTFEYKGEKKEGVLAYTLRIKMPQADRMFSLERKKERARGRVAQSMAIWLEKIEPFGREETVCISVSHPNSLFITEDFIVTHNTALEVGLALNEHHRSLIVRKNFVDLAGVLHTLDNILGKENSAIGGNRPLYRKQGGGQITFEGLGDSIDSKQGNAFDLLCVDEAAQVSEHEVRMLMGWLRTDRQGQRCRVVFASNPPLNSTGDWLLNFFGPWLDPKHHNPAAPGELRYFLPDDNGGDRECDADEFIMLSGVRVSPQSRTYIPAKFTDNKYIDSETYAKTLAALPAGVRERLSSGNFLIDRADDVSQTLPTDWVRAAQNRWVAVPPLGVPQCAIGLDVAQGGDDKTVAAIRYDGWFAPLIVKPGKETPDGKKAAGLVIEHRRDNSKVIVDLGGGWGGDCHAHLRENGIDSVGYMGVKTSKQRTCDNTLKFFNVRAEAYWRFREALDPSQAQGSPIALPHDSELLADLCAPTFEITANGIKLESKDDVRKRLKRSPDKGDAVIMAWWAGQKLGNQEGGAWNKRQRPKVIMGRADMVRRK
jgi:hypothetical protein